MATLTSTKIKNTYDALLKSIDNDAIGTTAKQITDGLGNITPLYVSTTQIGIGVTPETGLNLHVFGDAKIGSNLTVIGNLVVEGSTTTVGTDTLTVKDPLIVLANNNTSTDAVDIGFYGKYHPSNTTLYSGLFREALTGKYRLFKGLEVEPTTTVNTSGTGYAKADLVIGVLEATTGDFSGNVDIDGQLDVDDVISVEGSAFGRIEIGGASGGYIDLKAPNSDDYDLRIITSSGGNEVTTATGDLIFNTAETLALTIDTSQDATFEGNIIVSGTVDGRDIATDGAKLDGIESGATADQTAAEIKTAYESNSNTNAFTDADETKLDGIEASADVTDATNVLAAGAVMTTGNQSIGGVKTFSDQVTILATPSASTDAASKGYVDAAVEGQDTLAEILAIGNTTGGTDIAITSGDKITNFTSTGIDDNASSETIYITSGGKIGIDEDTPLAKLTVNQDSLVDTEGIMVQSGNDAGNGGVAIFKSANLVGTVSALGSQGELSFMTGGGSERLRIDSSGDVQLQTVGAKLRFQNSAGAAPYIKNSGENSSTAPYGQNLEFYTGGSKRLTIDNSGNSTFAGNVGIGTSPSDGNFQVKKAGVNTGITNVLMNASFSEASGSLSGLSIGYRTDETTAVLAARTATGNIAFMSYDGGWSESMRIANTGNVGIGTDSPDAKLDILGQTLNLGGNNGSWNARTNSTVKSGFITSPHYTNAEEDIMGMIMIGLSNANEINIGGGTSTYNAATDIKFFTASNSTTVTGTERLHIDSSGNSTFAGTVEATNVGINGFITHNGDSGTFMGWSADDTNVFYTAGNERLRIDADGNIGIGAAPSFKLDVQGTGGPRIRVKETTDNTLNALVEVENSDGHAGMLGIGGSNRTDILDNKGFLLAQTGTDGLVVITEGADPIIFATGGLATSNERMRIDSSGNVGIGTTSPSAALTVKTESSITARFLGRSTDGFSFLNFRNNQDTATNGEIGISNAQNMLFYTGTSEKMRLTSGGDLHVDGDVVAYSTTISDKRLKDNVKPLESSLDKVMNLKGVEYVWNNGSRKGQKDIGFIAQEVEDVIPEIVREKQVIFNKEEKYKTVDYEKITAVLVEAVKELTAKVERLENNKCNCK